MAGNFSSIPTIDFALSTSSATRPQFLSELRDAILNVGFFYLKTQPIPEHVQQGLLDQAIKFFDLPAEKKQEVDIINSKHFLGYIGQEATLSKSTADRREIYTIGMDQPAPGPDEPLYRNLHGPNLWPDESDLPQFRQTVQDYLQETGRLADDFKILIAEALELEPTAFVKLFDDPPDNRLVLAKYPPPPPSSDDETPFQGIGTHKDSGFLTFLFLGTAHAGLVVQNRYGDWISVPPKPDTLVVNIGRQLEALTDGVCKATTHCVSFNRRDFLDEDGNSLGPRYTFPLFQSLKLDLKVQDTSVKIPPHIAEMVTDGEVISDATNVTQEVFKEGIGAGAFHGRALRNRWVTEKWYPGLLDEVKRTRKRIRNNKS